VGVLRFRYELTTELPALADMRSLKN
jgi:hypothetical protein